MNDMIYKGTTEVTPLAGDRIYYICGNTATVNLRYVKYIKLERSNIGDWSINAYFAKDVVAVDTGTYEELKAKYDTYTKIIASICCSFTLITEVRR